MQAESLFAPFSLASPTALIRRCTIKPDLRTIRLRHSVRPYRRPMSNSHSIAATDGWARRLAHFFLADAREKSCFRSFFYRFVLCLAS